MLALTLGDSPALGNIWRVTAKKTDFYLDPLDDAGAVGHLSVHGPNDRFDGHRFHMKCDRRLAAIAKDRNVFVMHTVPRKGYSFSGQQLAARAFRVARIRWTWEVQRPRFRAAAVSASAPELAGATAAAGVAPTRSLPRLRPARHAGRRLRCSPGAPTQAAGRPHVRRQHS
jgi:hypothetical protein